MKDITVGFIGFGLIGGSIARSLKKNYPSCKLIAYNYNKEKPNCNLEAAKNDGILDKISTDFKEGFSHCNIIFLCAPVLTNIVYLKELKHHIKPDCILTDVGSVKGNIHKAIEDLGLEEQFIGGHPMAGSEKTGYQNSSITLLQNAFYILTPTEKTPDHMTRKLTSLVSEIGAIPVILNSKEHDDITAAISHVPHIIAATLVNMVKTHDDEKEKMRALAAGGFKDITRIASSSPIMWQNICLTNRESILKFLEIYQNNISEFIKALEEEDQQFLLETFELSKEYRDALPVKPLGKMDKVFEIYLDLPDESGAIANVASILAKNKINIKNIGILHNREFSEGVLHIEFYEDDAKNAALPLLIQHQYKIYE